MTTREEIELEYQPYLGTLMLNYWDVVLYTGIDQDDTDYYYVVESMDHKHPTMWITCVGKLMPLKGKIAEEDYNELVRVWNLNNTEKAI